MTQNQRRLLAPNFDIGFENFIAFDCETHLITDDNLAPRLVCASIAQWTDTPSPTINGQILTRNEAFEAFEAILADPGNIIVGANIAYDFGVLATERPELLSLIFLALREGKVFDVLIAEGLNAIAGGHLGLMPDGQQMRNAKGRVTDRYSLDICVRNVLGRSDAKSNAEFVLRYGQLESLPMDQWPIEAIQYPIDDACNTLEVVLSQIQTHENLTDMTAQVRAAFHLHLGAMTGINTDQEAAYALRASIEEQKQGGEELFVSEGLLRPPRTVRHRATTDTPAWEERKVSRDMLAIKRRYLESLGSEQCTVCTKYASDYEISMGMNGCDACRKTGYEIPAGVALTDGGDISTAREVLFESTDEVLQVFAEYQALDKIQDTYLPAIIDHPIILPRPNVLLATGRCSYNSIIQLLPREGGVRECFTGGEGNVLLSHDYSQLELCTFAQNAIWLVQYSKMAELINAGLDVHSSFGSKITNREYEEFRVAYKAEDEGTILIRNVAKQCNFGLLGGMGPFKLVQTARKSKVYVCRAFGYAKCVPTVTERGPICGNCLEIAKKLRGEWLEFIPEAPEYFDHISTCVDNNGELPQVVPASLLYPQGVARIRGGLHFTDGCNTMFQGLAAIGAKESFCEVSEACYEGHYPELIGTVPVLFLHDEILCKSPKGMVQAASPIVGKIMVDTMRKYVPDVAAGVKTNEHIMERWKK